MLDTPILFLIFNRPRETSLVFNKIRKQKPRYLYIAADGPRLSKEGEADKCRLTRQAVLENIDWDCTVKTLFREENRGCGRAVSEAITWFFEHVEEGMIIEDDCLPNDTFFQFCSTLLEKYRHDDRISAISGNNFQAMQPMALPDDYYFSLFPSSWGWATWKRSWKGYDLNIASWPTVDQPAMLKFLFKEKPFQLWWKKEYDNFYDNRLVHTWDFQFHYLSMVRHQLSIIPIANLVSNIGHGPEATHFHNPESHFANIPTHQLQFPLRHPARVVRNYNADVYVQRLLFGEVEVVSPLKKVKRYIKKIIMYNPS